MEKVFSELMAGKKIMYIHGFLSAASSGTVKLLREMMPKADIIAQDLPIHPEEAIELLCNMQQQEKPDLIIGTSMGGMYAELLHGTDRILVNPAFNMGDHLTSRIGKQKFQSERADGVQEIMVTKGLVKEYKDVCAQSFKHVTEGNDNSVVYGLFGDDDPIGQSNFPLFQQHYANAIWFHGGHRLNDHTAIHYLSPVIRWIDDKQNGTDRPIIYMHYDALHDSYGNAVGSMRKAFEFLQEQYSVYIVADDRPYDNAYMQQVAEWVQQQLSAPAYRRLIFCHRKGMLYGDYFLDPTPSTEFMGTSIQLGSADFKTFEEVITFFERIRQ